MAQTGEQQFDLSAAGRDLFQFALDIGRARLIDVEQPNDTSNVPDQSDLRAGFTTAQTQANVGGGINLRNPLLIAAVVIGGVFLVRKFA